jgi:hypothetical protein
MIKMFNPKTLAGIIILALTITGCSKEEVAKASELKISNATAITNNDMIGFWELSRMVADTAVNLNNDNVYNENLLSETDCFNTMSITFNEDGTFITNNATMTFEAGSEQDQFACISDRIDDGDWEVRNDSLILHMLINGGNYTHKKLINMGSGKFSFDVNKIESDQYVNDPGNTQASAIRILELEYTRS